MSHSGEIRIIDYFDRISIVHLRKRTDRYRALVRELAALGIDVTDRKVSIPDAPVLTEANGFPSSGVHGNFLSHLDIIRSAQRDGLQTVLVMEDDAIVSRRFIRGQGGICRFLSDNPWEMCYFGHSLTKRTLAGLDAGFPRYSGPFLWAHCYAVHARIFPRLVSYMEETLRNPPGHPRGGRMYIDAVYSHFRKLNPDVIALVSNPVLAMQRGSTSGLSEPRWYDGHRFAGPLAGLARTARDEWWRWTGLTFGGAAPRG